MLSAPEHFTSTDLLSASERATADAQDMSLGKLIAARRKEKKLSQRALAKKLGLSHGAVAQWELDETRPDATRFPIVCMLLEIDVVRDLSASDQPQAQFVSEPQELALLGAFRIMEQDMRNAMMHLVLGRLGERPAGTKVDNNAA
jgi:transcriptional regulator with XRE-family HTH domain